jgi:hypothetical protein
MAPVIVALRELARATDAAVLLIHHRDKQFQHDFRGSGAIRDQADLMFVLARHPKDPKVTGAASCAARRCASRPSPPPPGSASAATTTASSAATGCTSPAICDSPCPLDQEKG